MKGEHDQMKTGERETSQLGLLGEAFFWVVSPDGDQRDLIAQFLSLPLLFPFPFSSR